MGPPTWKRIRNLQGPLDAPEVLWDLLALPFHAPVDVMAIAGALGVVLHQGDAQVQADNDRARVWHRNHILQGREDVAHALGHLLQDPLPINTSPRASRWGRELLVPGWLLELEVQQTHGFHGKGVDAAAARFKVSPQFMRQRLAETGLLELHQR